ncbi:hypothetical protein AHAS_Ahas19G0176200 [Arachis hypogaea]
MAPIAVGDVIPDGTLAFLDNDNKPQFESRKSLKEVLGVRSTHKIEHTNQVGHFQKVLTAIGNFCICSIAIGVMAEIIVMYPIQYQKYRDGINNLLVLLIGGIPIAMPTVLSVTMAIRSHRLSQQGALMKRMTAIEEMAGMNVLCSDKTGTLTLNKLSVDKNLIEVFTKGVNKDHVILLAARASRIENQDAVDAAIVGMLADSKEVRAGIRKQSANNQVKKEEKEEEDSLVLAMEMLGLNVVPLAVNSAVELCVFDTIAKSGEGAMLSTKQIASQIRSNNPEAPHMLDHLLRLLASHSLLRCSVSQQDHSHRLYSLSPRSKYFVTDADDGNSLGPTLALLLDNVFYQSWKEVKGAIMEGGIPFNRVYGMHAFEYPGKDQRFNEVFNKAMTND